MLNTSYNPWPSYSSEEAGIVSNVLLSNRVNYWTGDECKLFETEFAKWTDTSYAIALSNGTVALELALKALEIGSGDEVIVTPRTFIASASCVVTAGAMPVFSDIDRNSGNITAELIEPHITEKTKAVICVHLGGNPCDMDPIMKLANKYGLAVIEDCAQAHGARYKGKSVGSIGDIGAWSFCQDKIMTTGGEGGMVTTNNAQLWHKMWSFKDHGKSYDAVYKRDHNFGFRWLHESIGTNFRMTEIQAAIGRYQLKKMKTWHEARVNNLNAIYSVARNTRGLRVPTLSADSVHAAYKCYIYVENKFLKDGWDRDKVLLELGMRGVPCTQGSCSEVYLEKAFADLGIGPAVRLENARELGETSLMFMVHPTLTDEQIKHTCANIVEVMQEACYV